jgi:Electron transfer DM13
VSIRSLLRRPRILLAAAITVLATGLFVGFYFQPQKLLFDDKVADTVPANAVRLTVATPPVLTTVTSAIEVSPPVSFRPPEFISGAHSTTGTVELLVTAEGQHLVRLVDLATDNGPDLKVYLSAAAPGSGDDDVEAQYLSLGELRGNVGSQNYEIPAEADLSQYRSVVIWCDRFSVSFGSAPLPA